MYSTVKNAFSNKVILDTAQFGDKYGISKKSGVLNRLEVIKILKFSTRNNISYLDTAKLIK